jgi:hypothetical protein
MELERERERDEFYKAFKDKGRRHFERLYFVNKKKFYKGYGSYLFNGKQYVYDGSLYEKQKLLFNLCKANNKILEIGTYLGHSVLIMLLANPKINITAIDISDVYAKPSLDYLQKQFPDAKINFIKNDSIKELNNLKKKFDLFHVDGAHEHEVISKEFLFLLKLGQNKKIKILFDDLYCMPHLKDNILKNFQIKKHFSPDMEYPSWYVEIYVNDKKIEQNIKNFKFENFRIFYKYRLIKIILKKLLHNKVNILFYRLVLKNFKILEKIKNKIINLIYK